MGRPNKTGVKWRKRGEDEKEKMRLYQKEYKKRNKEAYRKVQKTYELRIKYGLSYENYEEMLKQQESKCAICQEVSLLHVDHCHKTNKIRGLLCQKCNIGIGLFKDNKEIIKRVLEYL